MSKLDYLHIVRDKTIYDKADLIAIRLENTNEYYIIKCRGLTYQNSKVDSDTFRQDFLPNFIRPMVFSDLYTDVPKTNS